MTQFPQPIRNRIRGAIPSFFTDECGHLIRSQVLYPALAKGASEGKSSYCEGFPTSTAD
jgi:hypothetical protein